MMGVGRRLDMRGELQELRECCIGECLGER